MDLNRFIVHVGTVRGFLLSTSDKPNAIKSSKCDEASEVTALTFGTNINEIVIGYDDGNVNIYDTEEHKYIEKVSDLDGKGRVVGLECINDSLVIAKFDGIVNIWDNKKSNSFKIDFDEKGTLDCVVLNKSRENIIGTGGEFNDFKLWDIETHQCVFQAKSLGHDYLNLPIPTSVRGITFFTDTPNLSACCTKEGHVLLYDDRAQRRPIMKFLEKKASYTCITSAHRERQCLVGTTRGYMQLLDLKTAKCLKTFTTFTGSVTSIVCDPLEPYVATTSLDRHLRIHNLETKELVHKVYMKQSLTRLLMKPIVKEEPTEDPGKSDDEYEDIFEKMEVVTEKKKKRKITLEDEAEVIAEKRTLRKHKSKENDKEKVVKRKSKKTKVRNPVSC
ncbi:hypothetical protein JTB14_027334 [Gonioctena quinquepunctata]|nr:hypothetical protein JTB14_027334 [Gonioctena quinquepunctata]